MLFAKKRILYIFGAYLSKFKFGFRNIYAFTFFEQACNGGDMTGCRYLGALYGAGSGVPQDIPRSLQLYEQACSGGEMAGVGRVGGGCYMLGAVYLGDIYDSVPKDSARARQLFARACDAGMRLACEKMRTIQAP